jgi:hypothetical protein
VKAKPAFLPKFVQIAYFRGFGMKKNLLLALLFAPAAFKAGALLFLFAALLLAPATSRASVNTYPTVGFNGLNVNNQITAVVAKTYPDNGSTHNCARITWTTPLASDSRVWIAIPGVDFSEADVGRRQYDATLVTSHSMLVCGLNPNRTYGFYVASCVSGCSGAPSDRTSGNMSSSPFGSNTTNVFTFQTPDTDHTHLFDWFAWFSGNHNRYMQGYQTLLSVNGIKTDGPDSNDTIISALSIDGQDCLPLSLGGNLCGTTHITVQPTCGYSTNTSPATNDYYLSILTGARAGQGFCYTYGIDHEQIQLRLLPDTSAITGPHGVSMTLLQTAADGSTLMGSAQTVTYTINVEAAPTFTDNPPTVFPAEPNAGAWDANMFGTYIDSTHQVTGAIQNYVNLKLANTTLPGIYNNDNGSSSIYTLNPWGVLTYRGADQVPLQIKKKVASVSAVFIPSHAYSQGDKFRSIVSGQVYVVRDQSGCTSGGSFGEVAPGISTTSGTCHLGNLGDDAFWLEMTERSATQQRDFLLELDRYTIAQEWTSFANLKWCFAHNSPANCATSRDGKAMGWLLSPYCPAGCNGSTPQRSIYSVAREPFGFRSLPYDTENFVAYWLAKGSSLNTDATFQRRLKYRSDMLIQVMNHVMEYSYTDGVSSTIACCTAFPGFDLGLGMEASKDLCAAQKLMLGSCDPGLKLTNQRMVDWLASHEYNLLGNDFSFPYNLWTEPRVSGGGFYNPIVSSLNSLMVGGFTWDWALRGDSATLASTGALVLTVADQIRAHTFDHVTGGAITGKENSEWYKGREDEECMRSGSCTAYQLSILPANNPQLTFPGKMESYAQESWPTKPAGTATSTSVDVAWYGYINAKGQLPVSASIKYGTTTGTINTTGVCAPLTIVTTEPVSGQYNVICHVAGLLPNTTYYFGVGTVDADSNPFYSQYDILLNNHPPFQFTTTGGPSCSITITGVLGPGQVGVPYNQSLGVNASGTCTTPFHFKSTGCFGVPCAGHDISGLTMADGGLYDAGSPSTSGTASLAVQACDSALPAHCQPKAYLISIAPLVGSTMQSFYGMTGYGITVP